MLSSSTLHELTRPYFSLKECVSPRGHAANATDQEAFIAECGPQIRYTPTSLATTTPVKTAVPTPIMEARSGAVEKRLIRTIHFSEDVLPRDDDDDGGDDDGGDDPEPYEPPASELPGSPPTLHLTKSLVRFPSELPIPTVFPTLLSLAPREEHDVLPRDDDGGGDLEPVEPPATDPPGYPPFTGTFPTTKSLVRITTKLSAPTVFPTGLSIVHRAVRATDVGPDTIQDLASTVIEEVIPAPEKTKSHVGGTTRTIKTRTYAPTYAPILDRDVDPETNPVPPHDPIFTGTLHTTKSAIRVTATFPVPTFFPTSLGSLLNRAVRPPDEDADVVQDPAPTVSPATAEAYYAPIILERQFDPETSPDLPGIPVPTKSVTLHGSKSFVRFTETLSLLTVSPTVIQHRAVQSTDEDLDVVEDGAPTEEPAAAEVTPDGAFSPDENVPTWVSPRPHPTVKSRIRGIAAPTALTVDKRLKNPPGDDGGSGGTTKTKTKTRTKTKRPVGTALPPDSDE